MITSLIRFSEPSSIPLISETSRVWGGMSGAQASRQARSVCAGTANTTRSAPSTASAASSVAVSDAGSGIPGRYLGFSWLVVIAVAISALRAQIVTGVPASASTSANVVPHDPAPSTAAFTARSPPAWPRPARQRDQARQRHQARQRDPPRQRSGPSGWNQGPFEMMYLDPTGEPAAAPPAAAPRGPSPRP